MIGLIAHSAKADARAALREMIAALQRSERFAFRAGKADGQDWWGASPPMTSGRVAKKSEILVVLGGDGTILRVVHKLGPDAKA